MAIPPKSGLFVNDNNEHEEDLRSRSDARRERKASEEALMQLAKALVDLPERTLAKLALPESLLDVVVKARLVPGGGPKNRALRLVRIVLRDGDADAIARALRDVHDPPRKGAAPRVESGARSELEEPREKLVAGGEDALTEYLAAFPDGDRRQLRQLVRNVVKAQDAARASALAALEKALRKSTR
ncbi:MAG TPA: ribosome biogenesis factor YjgA [Polyangiaceae bacterium]|nr:ribosome biogenesis factor YjgA [Polyangiaceae bacterium]